MRRPLRWALSILTVLGLAILCWPGVSSFSSGSSSSWVYAGAKPTPHVLESGLLSARVSASLALPTRKLSRPRQYGVTGHAGDVVTYHYNVARQGFTQFESVLNLSNVHVNTFGLVGFFPVDGLVDAQPLYLYTVPIGPNTYNVLYVATENDSVYAFDADHGQQLWKASTLLPGETPSDDFGCGLITPTIGITATPVIDRQGGMMYVVAMTKDSSGNYHHRLHALDLITGAERLGGPTEIQATYPGTGDGSQNGKVIFDPAQYAERAALLEYGGKIYLGFTSHCDWRPYTGWVMAYDGLTLKQTSVLNLTPNGNSGAIWMSGGGLAADGQGNIYLLDANGTFDTTLDGQGMPIQGDYGNAFLKLSPSPQLAVTDYFTMFDTVEESDADCDLGSGGAVVLPDLMDNNGQVHHLAVGAGKDGNFYVVDRDNMGKFNPDNDNAIYQEIDGALAFGLFGTPAYYNNTVYAGDVYSTLKAFSISDAKLSALPTSQTINIFLYPGATPIVSANLGSNAIVWAVDNNTPAVLHAYDANNLAHELYNSNQAGPRDQFGPGNKFITPVVANGKVFVGTQTGVAEFGLLSGNVTVTSSAAEASNMDGRLEIFARGPDNGLWHTSQVVAGGPNWNQWTSLGGVLASDPVVGQNADGRLEVFVLGGDYGVWHTSQTTASGSTWNPWSSLSGVLTSHIAVGRNSDGRLEIFARAPDNALWHTSQAVAGGPNWNPWTSLSGVLTSDPIVRQNADGRLEVFVLGGDFAVWHTAQMTASGSTWSPWSSLGGALTSNITAGLNSDGRLEVFARGTDDALWHTSQAVAGGPNWNQWTSLGGVLTSDPLVGQNADGRLEVFVLGGDYAVWHTAQTTASGSAWNPWSALGGVLTSDIAVGRNSDGRLEVFALGTDYALWHTSQAVAGGPNWNQWTSLGGLLESDLSGQEAQGAGARTGYPTAPRAR
jgi:hypothetical protein